MNSKLLSSLRLQVAHWMISQGKPFQYRSTWEKECDNKVAELIIAECAQHLTNIGHDHSRQELERHFGIE